MSVSLVARAPLHWFKHPLQKHITLQFYPLAKDNCFTSTAQWLVSWAAASEGEEWALLIWFHRHLESVAALISWASLGRLRCGKVRSGSTYYASQNLLGPRRWTPKWCVQSCCSVPDIGNPNHDFAKGKCHWQCEILKKGLWKWKMRGWEGF